MHTDHYIVRSAALQSTALIMHQGKFTRDIARKYDFWVMCVQDILQEHHSKHVLDSVSMWLIFFSRHTVVVPWLIKDRLVLLQPWIWWHKGRIGGFAIGGQLNFWVSHDSVISSVVPLRRGSTSWTWRRIPGWRQPCAASAWNGCAMAFVVRLGHRVSLRTFGFHCQCCACVIHREKKEKWKLC